MEEGGVLGARGVLINITGSNQLGIHDVNEACNLIRAATENDDVQINFGVVLDESMGSNVKITVIATGFQRDSLPEIDRRGPHFPFSSTNVPDGEQKTDAVAEGPETSGEEHEPANDYDMPAILRKQKRSV